MSAFNPATFTVAVRHPWQDIRSACNKHVLDGWRGECYASGEASLFYHEESNTILAVWYSDEGDGYDVWVHEDTHPKDFVCDGVSRHCTEGDVLRLCQRIASGLPAWQRRVW